MTPVLEIVLIVALSVPLGILGAKLLLWVDDWWNRNA